jgi:hypothetical protein
VTILAITDISRKENFIYYRREFTGNALYDFPGSKKSGLIEFSIETAATGKKNVQIRLLDPVDYPVLPVVKSLKDFILYLDNEGKLP